MSCVENALKTKRRYPFVNMRLADSTVLNHIDGRFDCQLCNRSRKYFCYSCYVPVGNLGVQIPQVQLPISIDIIKHKKESDGKSTAAHAAVLSPNFVKIFTYPDIPDYSSNSKDAVLIFPSSNSITVSQLFQNNPTQFNEQKTNYPKGYNIGTFLTHRKVESCIKKYQMDKQDMQELYNLNCLPVKRAIFIDSTWNQSRGIYKDERIKCLRTVVLQNRCSQFWRHQKGSPRWYLATIEAIHQFLLEMHIIAWGLNVNYRGLDNLEIDKSFFQNKHLLNADSDDLNVTSPYNGHYDNLLYFFANMYDLIHKYYDHNELKSYRRPI